MSSESRLSIERGILLGALLFAAGCAAHTGPNPPALLVAGVKTAHHDACLPASRRVFGARAAQLFSQPIAYRIYHCGGHTEANLLQSGCGGNAFGRNTVFITLARPRSVQFVQDGFVEVAHIRTFGETWDDELHRAVMFFAGRDFRRPPLPPGTRRFVYRGPPFYGLFAIDGDPLGIAQGECPTSAV